MANPLVYQMRSQREQALKYGAQAIEYLEQAGGARGFIFKGFPRTLVQSYILDGLLRKHGWGISKIIDVYVRRIRAKIDTDGQPSLIQTLRGAGYRLRMP